MKPSLQNLRARIEQLEAARSRIDAAEVNPPAPIPQVADWDARLSAARAVDSLVGSETAYAVQDQREAERLRIEKHAKDAAKFAQEATRRREAMKRLTGDLEAAHGLLEREIRARSKTLVVESLTRYHAALAEVLEALARLTGALELSGEVTAANLALMSLTMPAIGDPALPAGFSVMAGRITAPSRSIVIAQAAAEARELLLNEETEETADA